MYIHYRLFYFKKITRLIYCPANDVPKIPTASSIHTIKHRIISITQMIILCWFFFTFLNTNSHESPVLNSRHKAAAKSCRDQFTSSVNCIPTNGMSNKIATTSTIAIKRLFWRIISLTFCFNVKYYKVP